MNLLLLEPGEIEGGVARLAGRRAEHLCRVLKVAAGSEVRLGVVGGDLGRGRVLGVTAGGEVELAVEADSPPPAASGVELIVALPRPQALKRILEVAATMRVERLQLVNAWRVERSFFSSPLLAPDNLRRHLLLGAEQGITTRLPEVRIRRFLVPFVSELAEPDPTRPAGARLLAHPAAAEPVESRFPPAAAGGRVTVAIGPEGGWIDREVETLRQAGFRPVYLGPWILRVETAVAAVLAQLELLRRRAGAGADRRDRLT